VICRSHRVPDVLFFSSFPASAVKKCTFSGLQTPFTWSLVMIGPNPISRSSSETLSLTSERHNRVVAFVACATVDRRHRPPRASFHHARRPFRSCVSHFAPSVRAGQRRSRSCPVPGVAVARTRVSSDASIVARERRASAVRRETRARGFARYISRAIARDRSTRRRVGVEFRRVE
jgi:hypothetical protein